MNDLICEFKRAGRVESVHRVRVSVQAEGKAVFERGDATTPVFMRSCAKPFQALTVLESGAPDAYGFIPEELALMAGSHGGEGVHVRAAQSMLKKSGVSPEGLRCGVHPPTSPRALRELQGAPSPLHNNCSGKHAGMLAACRFLGLPLQRYLRPSHPLQKRNLATLSRFTGIAGRRIPVGIDGCSAPTFALPLRAMARAAEGLATAEGSLRRIRDAMMSHPHMVGRPCASLMAAAPGRLVAKAGAEGVYLIGFPSRKAGLALKVEDGNARAWLPVIAFLVRRLRLLDPGEQRALGRLASPLLRNHAGLDVGAVRVR